MLLNKLYESGNVLCIKMIYLFAINRNITLINAAKSL